MSSLLTTGLRHGRFGWAAGRHVARSPALTGFAVLVVCVVAVEALVRFGAIPHLVVARPSAVAEALTTLQSKVDIAGAFVFTFAVSTAAMLACVLVALPVGYVLYGRADFGRAFEGWLAALFAAPVFLLYPLFMVIIGRTPLTLVVMGAIPGVIPMIIQVRQGLLGVPRTLLNVGLSFSLTKRQVFWKIMMPAATPAIFTGFRLGAMYVLVNIVAIEYLLDYGGLGRVVSDRYFRFDVPGTYASILAVAVVTVAFNWSIGRVERWLRPQ